MSDLYSDTDCLCRNFGLCRHSGLCHNFNNGPDDSPETAYDLERAVDIAGDILAARAGAHGCTMPSKEDVKAAWDAALELLRLASEAECGQ